MKLYLQAFWQNFENGKMQKFGFCLQEIKKSSPKLLNRILGYYAHNPGVCVIKICSNSGAIYFISEIIAKDNFKRANLLQTFEILFLQNYTNESLDIAHKWSLGKRNSSLLKWWRHLHYQRTNSQRQFEYSKLNVIFENLLLKNYFTKIFDIAHK